MKSPFIGTATTLARSMRWAMSSTASARDRGDVLDVQVRVGGRLERPERLRPELGARPVVDHQLEPVLHVRGQGAVHVDRHVARALAGRRGPDRRAVRRLDELDRDDRLAWAARRVLGLVPKRARVGGAGRNRRQGRAGRGGRQSAQARAGARDGETSCMLYRNCTASPLSPMQQRGQTPMLRRASSPGR